MENLQQENLQQQWQDLMAIPGVPWIVYLSLLVVMVLIAVYVAGFFKRLATGQLGFDHEEDFDVIREIHGRGMIADEEYEKVKQLITEKTDVDRLLNVKSVDQEKP
jgi:uncharacterized membrane protein